MLGDSVLDVIIKKIKGSCWFTCIMDETQDISTLEQVCICIRYIDESDLSVREDFVGFHDIIGTTAVEFYDMLIETINNLALDMRGIPYHFTEPKTSPCQNDSKFCTHLLPHVVRIF